MNQTNVAGLDPVLFDPMQIAPETCAFNQKLEPLLATVPSILDTPVTAVREARVAGKSFLGPVMRSPNGRERIIEGPAGPLRLRVFATPNATGVLLHLHGGGWALGSHDQQDVLLEAIGKQTGLAVVSVGYRLAPEHPYPAAPDDCEAAALWLVAHARREFGTDRLYIGGESAGAHLSVVTLLRLRDRHGVSPFRAAVLTYGGYDLNLTPSARRWGTRNLVLSTPILRKYTDWFAPPELRNDPDVSPLYADLSLLPAAIFTIGTLDPLLDDSLFMASRWAAAGNRAELAVYPGGMHAFNAFPIPLAGAANGRIVDFLVRHIAAS
jgi:acetyl esterase/lipase